MAYGGGQGADMAFGSNQGAGMVNGGVTLSTGDTGTGDRGWLHFLLALH